jgi:hypothetical protein
VNRSLIKQILSWAVIAVVALASTTALARQRFGTGAIAPVTVTAASAQSPEIPPRSPQSKIHPEVAKATLAQLLQGVNHTPDPPAIRRTVVKGNYALATWQWGPAGGQSVLIQKRGQWQVVNSGGGLLDLPGLQASGVPLPMARVLMQREQMLQQQ